MNSRRSFPRRTGQQPFAQAFQDIDPTLAGLIDQNRHDSLRARIEAGFLGSALTPTRTLNMGLLRAGLLWDCLPVFLERDGWALNGQLGFDGYGQEIVQPQHSILELAPDNWLEIPRNVSLFAHKGSSRLLFGLIFHDSPFGGSWELSLKSDQFDHVFVSRWERFAADHNPLKGRSIRPSGEFVSSSGNPTWGDLHLEPALKERIRFQARRLGAIDKQASARHRIRRRVGFILAGPPGTGKTMIGKILAAESASTFIWVLPADISEPEEVREVLQLARLLSPSTIFLEDLDLLAEDRDRCGGSLVLGELMNQLDGFEEDCEILTIATTNRLGVLETALRSRPGRFDRVFEIPPLRRDSCRRFLSSRFAACDIDDDVLAWLSESVEGRTGAELEEIANTALVLALEEGEEPRDEALRISRLHLEESLQLCEFGTRGHGLGFTDLSRDQS